MPSCADIVDSAESVFTSMFPRWGSLPWVGIGRLSCGMCPLNPWQEAYEALLRGIRYSESLRTPRGGQGGRFTGRPTTGTSGRFQSGKSSAARDSRWSKLSDVNLRTVGSIRAEKLCGLE